MIKECLICSAKFEAYNSGKLCSDECRSENKIKNDAEYYLNNRLSILNYAKEYYKNNRKKIISKAAKWNRDNPKEHSKHASKHRKRNPERYAIYTENRRTRKSQAGGSFSAQEWFDLCKKCKFRCLCCGKKRKLTADHVVSVAKGGTSSIDNIQPLCGPCNSSKGTKSTDYR